MKMIITEKSSQNKNTLTGQVKAFLKKAGITDVDPAKFATAFKSENPSAQHNEILAKVLKAIMSPKNAADVVNALPLLKRAIQKLKSKEDDAQDQGQGQSAPQSGGQSQGQNQQPPPIPQDARKKIDQETQALLKQYIKNYFNDDPKQFSDALKSQGLIENKIIFSKKEIIDIIKQRGLKNETFKRRR